MINVPESLGRERGAEGFSLHPERSFVVETITLTAPDISCAHCKSTIEREVGSMAGVGEVSVDVESKGVRVSFDPAQTSRAAIVERLDEEGYPVPE